MLNEIDVLIIIELGCCICIFMVDCILVLLYDRVYYVVVVVYVGWRGIVEYIVGYMFEKMWVVFGMEG